MSTMKLSLWVCVAITVCVHVAVVQGQGDSQDDDSFQNSLKSFLSNLFGGDTTTTLSPPNPEQRNATLVPTLPSATNLKNTTLSNSTVSNNTQPALVSALNQTINQGPALINNSRDQIIANATRVNATVPINAQPAFESAINQTINQGQPPMNNSSDQVIANDTRVNGSSTIKNDTQTQTTLSPLRSSTSHWPSTSTSWYYDDDDDEEEQDRTCYMETVIENYCSAPSDLTDVSFWELYAEVFSDSVLDGLIEECMDGAWCLHDKYDYWNSMIAERVDIVMNSEIVESICKPGVISCIDNMAEVFKNCSFHYLMVFTSEALDLVCNLKSNELLTEQCYKHVIEALHVTLADQVRTYEKGPGQVPQTDDTCESPEAHMTQGLICIANSCPGEGETFQSFKPWSWFTSVVDDLIMECEYNISECIGLLQKPANYVEPEDLQMMITVSTATMVTAVILSLTVCVCYRRYRRNAVIKDGYQKLLNEGDES